MASSFLIDATKAALDHRLLPNKEIKRRDAKYHPSVWGEYFIQFSETIIEPSPAVAERMEKLKKQVRALLEDDNLDIGLIDWIQRCGIAFYFEKEINKALEHVYQTSITGKTSYKYQLSDLYYTALRFRLLRQQGYHVSSDMFERFMDTNGKFNENNGNDIEGLLSLYEASHMSVKDEMILDEALEFAREKLTATLSNLNGSLALQVKYALDLPLQRCTETLKIRRSISCYESEITRNESVLKLAMLEFNLQQAMHRKELAKLTRWYKDLDVAGKLSFSRDRLVELYFWALESLSEPQYSRARIIALKIYVIISISDDLYDVYGTLEELEIFTSAVERWDMQVLQESPECLKEAFSILLKVFKEIEESLNPEEVHRMVYLREATIPYLKSYFVDAKWFFTQHFPTFNEYMDNALISCGYPALTVVSLMGLDEIATKEVFDWAMTTPSIVHAASIINRNRNDIVGHKKEQEKGEAPTGVECYMKDYGCTQEEAYKALQAMVDDAWKQINYELLHNSKVPRAILLRVVGLARVISVLYQNGDSYSDSRFETKDRINFVLVEPFPV